MRVEWKALLLQRWIFPYTNRERQHIETIIDVVYRSEHNPAVIQGDEPTNVYEELKNKKGEREKKGMIDKIKNAKYKEVSEPRTGISENMEDSVKVAWYNLNYPRDEDSSYSKEDDRRRPIQNKNNQAKDVPSGKDDTTSKDDSALDNDEKGSRLGGFIRSFADMPKYGGSFQGDLDETI